MKSLQQFKVDPLLEEEKTDYSKFDMLVRAGLANKAQLQRIHKILDKMHEERPQFNSADRQILQNLFNKMVDLLSNNKQIFQKTRQAVREEVELDEAVLDTTDFKIGASGKKVKAHRVKVGDVGYEKDVENIKENIAKGEPPFVLVLKRKAFRMYPNNLKVALYYNDRMDKYFSVPYIDTGKASSVVQAEEQNHGVTVLRKIFEVVESKRQQKIVLENAEVVNVDYDIAIPILEVFTELNQDNQNKLLEMIGKNAAEFNKVATFALSKQK